MTSCSRIPVIRKNSNHNRSSASQAANKVSSEPARAHHAPWKSARGMEGTREDVIRSIDAGTNTFFVLDPYTGKRSDVGVVRPSGRAPYVRTHADGDWNDNLLSLNQCTL